MLQDLHESLKLVVNMKASLGLGRGPPFRLHLIFEFRKTSCLELSNSSRA